MDKEYYLNLISRFFKERYNEKTDEWKDPDGFNDFFEINETFLREVNSNIEERFYKNYYQQIPSNNITFLMFYFYAKLKEEGWDTENSLSLVVFYDWTDEELMKNNFNISEAGVQYLLKRESRLMIN